jgi:diadenosine tetraphosphate (Ap4A) HIT family hydrolase
MTDPYTLFSEILAGRAPASFVYRDEQVAAFMDLFPVNPGHVLVIPNEPIAGLSDLPEDTGAHLFRTGQRIARALRRAVPACEGVNLFLADGEAAGQEIFHVHLHVIPRYRGDGFGLRFPAGRDQGPERAELDRVAERINAALQAVGGAE